MAKVQLPPGCFSLRIEGVAKPYKANRPGGFTTIDEPSHLAAIDRMPGNGTAGLVTAKFREFGTGAVKNGRWCTACQPARLWNAWNARCPKCDAETVPEEQTAP